MAASPVDVVIIGAGLAGLQCALTLESRGYAVQVLEAGDEVGGRIRTDVVDGFLCDRGFQLLNPAYPAAKRFIDLKALDLQQFDAGVAVAGSQGLKVLGDPRRAPRLLGRTLTSGYLNPLDLLRLARWAAPSLGPVRRLLAAPDESLAESLDHAKVTGRLRREILEPFLTGVLADDTGSTSSDFSRLLLRSFLLGTPGVPAGGMAALPLQLNAQLRSPVRLNVRALDVRAGGEGPVVVADDGEHKASAVVIATDAPGAAALTSITAPRMKGLSTYWFSAPEPPTTLNLLFVDGRRSGPVVNTAVMTNAAPSYAPSGRHLIQATCLLSENAAPPTGLDESAVRKHLAAIYGTSTGSWDLLLRHDVPHALPEQLPPLHHCRPVDLGNRLFVTGDHRDTASIQGALVSGRRVANAVTAALRSRS